MTHTKNTLHLQLKKAGIIPSDTLLVHSSLKSMGAIDGGADTVLDALEESLADGLLVLPTLSYATVDKDHPFFSVPRTPSCVGALSEVFRKRPESARSWHPTHSVAATGKDAESFITGHEWDSTPCGRTSPWGRLLDRKAKILFIGTGLSCNTFLHGVEEWNKVPDYFTKEPEMLAIETPAGERIERGFYRHDQHNSDHYAKIEPLLIDEGVVTKCRIGDADCHLADCAGLERVVTGLLQKDIRFFSDNRP
jgi:aminoglycoside 3-N-acetyltransferase